MLISFKKLYSEIIKEGWLTKEGHIVKSWKVRWFILSKDTLLYFKTIKNLRKPLGTIKMAHAELQEDEKKHTFAILDKSCNKKFRITAKNEEEKQAWIEAVSYCINVTAKKK